MNLPKVCKSIILKNSGLKIKILPHTALFTKRHFKTGDINATISDEHVQHNYIKSECTCWWKHDKPLQSWREHPLKTVWAQKAIVLWWPVRHCSPARKLVDREGELFENGNSLLTSIKSPF